MNRIEIAKIDDRYWGYAYLYPRTEKKIAEKFQKSGILCYLPTMPHAYMDHYTKVITQIPMFPGYIFLCLDRDEATNLRYQEKKIVKIELQFSEEREKALIKDMQALQQCEELAKLSPILINPGIVAGDKVLITTGPLKDLVTDVVRRDDEHNSIIVNFSILGQHIEYSVSAAELEKITD